MTKRFNPRPCERAILKAALTGLRDKGFNPRPCERAIVKSSAFPSSLTVSIRARVNGRSSPFEALPNVELFQSAPV